MKKIIKETGIRNISAFKERYPKVLYTNSSALLTFVPKCKSDIMIAL
jgi:hypothetical protein